MKIKDRFDLLAAMIKEEAQRLLEKNKSQLLVDTLRGIDHEANAMQKAVFRYLFQTGKASHDESLEQYENRRKGSKERMKKLNADPIRKEVEKIWLKLHNDCLKHNPGASKTSLYKNVEKKAAAYQTDNERLKENLVRGWVTIKNRLEK